MKYIYILILFSNIIVAQNDTTKVKINNLTENIELIGELGEKLGSTHTVKGIIVEGPSKGYDNGPNLLIQMIDEKSNQFPIQIPISSYFGKFGDAPIPKIEMDSSYAFRVYETGEFIGVPYEAYKEANIGLQTSGFCFRNRLVVISGKKIKPIKWSPSDFLDRNALLSGIAKNENDTAIIVNSNWKLKLNGCEKWKKSAIGKLCEAYGLVKKTNSSNIFIVLNCEKRLISIEDQIGSNVKLRGRAISLNGAWWFNYRGTDISVEKMGELPNWSENNHFRPIEISGILEKCKANDKCNTEYIIRYASWAPINNLFTPELNFSNK